MQTCTVCYLVSIGDLLDVVLRLLRRLAVLIDPRADRGVADVLHDRRERVDEVAELVDERLDQDERRQEREGDDPQHDDQRCGTPAKVELALHDRHDRLEHES